MDLKLFVLLTFILAVFTGYSQENPKIDKKEILTKTTAAKEVTNYLNNGDSFYKEGLYDAALSYYLRLYNILDTHSPLNYKTGVSCLNGTNPKDALFYFSRTESSVATDYYYQLGRAYLFNNRYREAKESFKTYLNSLSKGKQRKMTEHINQLVEVCNFSEQAYRDSLPVFIINLGPNVNSYYDDYSPVEYYVNSNPQLYFTTRRPKTDVASQTNPEKFKEWIFYSPVKSEGQYGEAFHAYHLASKKNVSVSGADNKKGILYIYKGKKRAGDIYAVKVKPNGKMEIKKGLKNKYNKQMTKETSISFADNGDFYYITDRRGGVGGKDIWYVEKVGDKKYKKPVNLGKEINTKLDEEGVFITGDGNTLYFSSNGHPGFGNYDIFKVEKNNSGNWGKVENMGYPINSPNDDLFYRPSSNPIIAYFATKRQGGFGGLDIHMAKKDLRIPFELKGNVIDMGSKNNLYATVTLFDKGSTLPVGSALNDSIAGHYSMNLEDTGDFYVQVDAVGYKTVIEPFVSPTVRLEKVEMNFELERLLRPFTLKGYVVDLKTSRPIRAEIIMKPQGEDSPVYRTISDANSGFYTITLADKLPMDFKVSALNYHERIEELAIDREAGSEMEKNVSLQRSIIVYTLTGKVIEEGTDIPVKSTLSVQKRGEDKILQAVKSSEATGEYEIQLTDIGPFNIEITAEDYFFANEVVMFVDTTEMTRNFELKKLKSGAKFVIDNILFNSGNATLKPESYTELNKLVVLLKENPKVRIEVSGHTDNVGSATLNKNLSKSRALSVMNYLVSQGIASSRIEYEGYGFDMPIAPNTTPEGRAANRRVEMKILD